MAARAGGVQLKCHFSQCYQRWLVLLKGFSAALARIHLNNDAVLGFIAPSNWWAAAGSRRKVPLRAAVGSRPESESCLPAI